MNLLNIRIGQGFDVHRFADNSKLNFKKPLILMGCIIPSNRYLVGHSDADVMIHAVIDALLGAACLGDIGQHFPDNNSKYSGIDSLYLLESVVNSINYVGWYIVNVDICLIGEYPKISKYTFFMRQYIAKILNVDVNDVNIKATTTEQLGYLGRCEGLAAQVVVLLYKMP